MGQDELIHQPVLLKTSVDLLGVKKGKWYLDATIGAGGHGAEIVKRGGKLIGLDLDAQMLEFAKTHLTKVCPNGSWQLQEGNFAHLEIIVAKLGLGLLDGVLFDLGLSAYHYYQAKRGFSFNDQEKVDMRLGKKGMSANDLLKQVSKEQLTEILRFYAQEPLAEEISQSIIQERGKRGLTATRLARLVEEIYFLKGKGKSKTHPATRTFLALRLWVNREPENLRSGLAGALQVLKSKGRLVVISFHSGEDRIVKNTFKGWEREGQGIVVTDKPVFPEPQEVQENPLSRSAVLRAFEKK